jgi:hypothetical protein
MLGPQARRQLQDALISAFPTRDKLKQFSLYELGENLEKIANCSGDLSEIAFGFIEWAVSEGNLEKLINTAWKNKPTNQDLKKFVEEIWEPLQSQPMLATLLPQEGGVQMHVKAQTFTEKLVEPQSETVDINSKKYLRPHTKRSPTKKQINISKKKEPQPVSPISSEVDFPSKSPSPVLALALTYYEKIKQEQMQVLSVYLLFGVDTIEEIPLEQYEHVTKSHLFDVEDIWPEHCDFAAHLLQEAAQPVQAFYDLVKDALTRERSTEVVQLQSSLMIPLRMSCELHKNLISLLSEFREVCQILPDDMLEQRREIVDHLKNLRETLEQIHTTMDAYSQ